MKLGISKPRTTPYVPRKIDAKATKDARTRHARGHKALHALVWGRVDAKAPSIPAPGLRAPERIDPEQARDVRRSRGNWTRPSMGRGRAKLSVRRGVSLRPRIGGLHAAAMPSLTDRERKRARKAARKARKANR